MAGVLQGHDRLDILVKRHTAVRQPIRSVKIHRQIPFRSCRLFIIRVVTVRGGAGYTNKIVYISSAVSGRSDPYRPLHKGQLKSVRCGQLPIGTGNNNLFHAALVRQQVHRQPVVLYHRGDRIGFGNYLKIDQVPFLVNKYVMKAVHQGMQARISVDPFIRDRRNNNRGIIYRNNHHLESVAAHGRAVIHGRDLYRKRPRGIRHRCHGHGVGGIINGQGRIACCPGNNLGGIGDFR